MTEYNIEISIEYFGYLQTVLSVKKELWQTHATNTDELLIELRERGDDWQQFLSPEKVYRIVVNNQLILSPYKLHDKDQVAILPPVTGG